MSSVVNVPENVYAYIKGQNTINSLECGCTLDDVAMEDATSDLIYSDAQHRQNVVPYYSKAHIMRLLAC
jgi:hypothetical protein